MHGQDAFQEKLSLSDRFGITVTFLAPDQDRYLAIVAALAERALLERQLGRVTAARRDARRAAELDPSLAERVAPALR